MTPKKEILLGIFLGILIASIFVVIISFSMAPSGMPLKEFFGIFFKGNVYVPVLSFALFPNIALFFILLKFNKDNYSKGLMVATMLIGAIILILKIYI